MRDNALDVVDEGKTYGIVSDLGSWGRGNPERPVRKKLFDESSEPRTTGPSFLSVDADLVSELS